MYLICVKVVVKTWFVSRKAKIAPSRLTDPDWSQSAPSTPCPAGSSSPLRDWDPLALLPEQEY